ncbi:MAG: hypothetical protein OXG58_03115 [Gemmatimonadetes bacterium]|nr:hypothetical protein [Gemmatimonadota bacterium]MCY3944424.1 hypothetical protein [Gemmatimonadota bacterium]
MYRAPLGLVSASIPTAIRASFLGVVSTLCALHARATVAQEVPLTDPATSGLDAILRVYYERPLRGSFQMSYCSPDRGNTCFNGDHEDRRCRMIGCRTDAVVNDLAADVERVARGRLDDPLAVAQAVYALSRLGRHPVAAGLAEECAAVEWWCGLVAGMAYHRAGREEIAEGRFRSGLAEADPEVACRLEGVSELLHEADRHRYQELACSQRGPFHERFWWLADPMLTTPGNDRWSEHVTRRFELLLHERLVRTTRLDVDGLQRSLVSRHQDRHEALVVRRGFEDSWSTSSRGFRSWVSQGAARYQFVPTSPIGAGLEALSYDLEAGEFDEGYTPTDYGPLFELRAQFGRFRESARMVVVAAARPDLTPLDPAEVRFLATDRPGGALRATGPLESARHPTFVAEVPYAPLLVAIETVDGRGTAARAREGLGALASSGLGLSDPLLVEASADDLPESREEALAAMRGSTRVEWGREIVLYWEVYGLRDQERIEVSVGVSSERETVTTRIMSALGVRSEAAAPVVAWSELASGEVHPMAIAIDVRALHDGDYTLVLAVSTTSGGTATAERRFGLAVRG